MYYTYVLRIKKDSKLYTGYTDDLKNRLKLHNDGREGIHKEPFAVGIGLLRSLSKSTSCHSWRKIS